MTYTPTTSLVQDAASDHKDKLGVNVLYDDVIPLLLFAPFVDSYFRELNVLA